MDPLSSDLFGLIAVLSDHDVEFVVVGGTAAVLLGAPLTTLDVDVVYRQTPENAERLHRALTALGAEARPKIPERKLVPTQATLETAQGPILLTTPQGPLDLLPKLDPLGNFAALQTYCSRMNIAGKKVLVINVEALILSKQHANRPKDRLALPILLSLRLRKAGGEH